MTFQQRDSGVNPWRATLSGLCALLVGIGLARFAYTPLIPALIEADWFTPSRVVYLGAANLAGYLVGALLAHRMAVYAAPHVTLRAMMLLATMGFFACAFPISFSWYFVWRFASGVSGGVLMALAAPTVLSHVAASRRGLAGGVIFTGVGLGIAASGTLVPLLLRLGLVATWFGLGTLALVLTVLAWRGWPVHRAQTKGPPAPPQEHRAQHAIKLITLYIGYALIAAGLTPHMVFLVDFVARGLDRGLVAGGSYWVLFGIGALVGPVLAGKIADRIGFALTLRLSIVIQAACVGWLAFPVGDIGLAISSVVIGAAVPGVVPLLLGRLQELTLPEARIRAWSIATAAFAIGQAGGAYGFAILFDRTGSYVLLFALGAAMFVIAMAIDLRVSAFMAIADRRPARD
jgi:predicted MFS family arabinose efflux permease